MQKSRLELSVGILCKFHEKKHLHKNNFSAEESFGKKKQIWKKGH
jgi:hypothetical protein